MTWHPISRAKLDALISANLEDADDDVLSAWERIKIEPEKWQCMPWGDQGGGFWAVAVSGDAVIWFNDIEDGFNISRFKDRGVIDEYFCNQSELQQVLIDFSEPEVNAGAPASEVPKEARGPGRILRRQTTYWTLQPEGARIRVHFSGKREATFVVPEYAALEICDEHPLLQDYSESWSSLFLAPGRSPPADIIESMSAGVAEATDGWRRPDDYDEVGRVREVFRAGHGLVIRAPHTVVRRLADRLDGVGLRSSIVRDGKERGASARPRALLMGRSFVIAHSFRFDTPDADV